MQIKLNTDNVSYKAKPKGATVGSISNRMRCEKGQREIEATHLVEVVKAGIAFTPALLNGSNINSWISQQLIAIDIDNDETTENENGEKIKACIADPETPTTALEKMKQHNLKPLLMYYTFSSTDEWPRFRIIFLLDKPITEWPLIEAYTAKANALFKGTDSGTEQPNRFLYGTLPERIIINSSEAMTATQFEALPEPPKAASKASERATDIKRPQPKKSGGNRSYDELKAIYHSDIENYSIAEYLDQFAEYEAKQVGGTLYYNPCPICGHYDHFHVRGGSWQCYSKFNTEKYDGGNIINLLEIMHNMDQQEAIEYFKFDLMNYSRQEWESAYKRTLPERPQQQAQQAAADTQQAQQKFNGDSNKPDSVSQYINETMADDIQTFRADIKTGFSNLDLITGGLYPGLYCLAAISSLGKTTFAHQMADQMAAAGHEVLFFSMEQSRLEMAAKSIARQTYIDNPATAVSSLSIRKGYLPDNVLKAASTYQAKVGDRMSIIEGNFNCSIGYISEYINQYLEKNDALPVVIIDYLQILQPEQANFRGTTKEVVDRAILELKKISRRYNLTVLVICSVNRSNYLLPVDFESIKESGAVEFTVDVCWGLQLQCLNEELFEKEKKLKEKRARVKTAKAETPRKVQLVCLKNRYGISSYEAFFNYYPANDYFEPIAEADIDFMQPTAGSRL